MKKIGIALCTVLLIGCSSSVVKEGQGTYENNKGEVASAKIKMKDDKIEEVELDESTKDTTKKTLKEDYGMKLASSIGKEWYEQVRFLEDYIQKNGIENIVLNDEGKADNTDVLTGCTIRIDGFIKAIDEATLEIKSQE